MKKHPIYLGMCGFFLDCHREYSACKHVNFIYFNWLGDLGQDICVTDSFVGSLFFPFWSFPDLNDNEAILYGCQDYYNYVAQ